MQHADKLAAIGCKTRSEDLENVIIARFKGKYQQPDDEWTVDSLICNTPVSRKFTKEIVRFLADESIPLALVAETLVGLRKQRRIDCTANATEFMRYEDVIQERGYAFSIDRFREIIRDTFEGDYPERTDENVACDHDEADRFVAKVGSLLGYPNGEVPHWMVMGQLYALRKRSMIERRTSRHLKADGG